MASPAPSPGDTQERFGGPDETLKLDTTPRAYRIAGLALLAMPFLVFDTSTAYFLSISAGFWVLGFCFLAGRQGVALDRRRGQVRAYAKVAGLRIRFPKPYPVTDKSTVKITYYTHKDAEGNESSSFHVRMNSEKWLLDDEAGELLLDTGNHEKARRLAEQVAKFFRLGIADYSSGKTLIRDAQAVNESLRDRLARYGRVPAMPERPVNCRIRESVAGDQVEFSMPRFDSGLFKSNAAQSCITVITFGFLFLMAFHSSRIWYRTWTGGGAIVLTPMICFTLFALTFRESVRVSKEGLALLMSSVFGRRERKISSEALEELFVGVATDSRFNAGREAVVARSDALSLEFGARLTDDERRWLRDVIFYLVTAPDGTQ